MRPATGMGSPWGRRRMEPWGFYGSLPVRTTQQSFHACAHVRMFLGNAKKADPEELPLRWWGIRKRRGGRFTVFAEIGQACFPDLFVTHNEWSGEKAQADVIELEGTGRHKQPLSWDWLRGAGREAPRNEAQAGQPL